MSGTVDTRTVEMRFDNRDFESNAQQSISTLQKLKAALKLDGASKGLKEIERASTKLNMKDIQDNVQNVGKKFSILETIATGALYRIGASAVDAGAKIAKSLTIDQVASGWNKYAEKTTAVQTIMANLRDEEGRFVDEAAKLEHVNKYLDKLLWFSDETSYNFTDMTSNVGKFIANGQGLEESVTAMQGIASWAAVSGQNAQVASRAMYNVSQALGTGSMKIKDWMSIENANMATAQFKELAITIGKKQGKIEEGQVTIENFRESLSGKGTNGWFDKEVMMEVFETYGEAANRIQEYAEAHQITSTEAIREIKKADKAFADSIGFKAFAAAQEAKTFSEVVAATADAVSTKWMKIFENIFGNYLQAKEMWTGLAEDLWDVFAGPLDVVAEITSMWNKGFYEDGPKSTLQKWFESGRLDDLDNGLDAISKSAAELAVSADAATYKIETLSDGTKQLVKLVETAPGVYQRYTKKIYDADSELISGRTKLLEGFKNILDTTIHDVVGEDGKLESMSLFGAIKRGLQEVVFGTSEVEEIVPKVSKKLWELTNRFSEFTERLKPSLETSLRIKNSFKGLFTVFKIGGKFVKSVVKPFTDLFKNVFKNAPSTILDIADSFGTWIQRLDKFLDENNVFGSISEGIASGLNKIGEGVDWVSNKLTGKSFGEFFSDLKTRVLTFFSDFDFSSKFKSVGTFFGGIVDQIRQVNTGDLPEKLTPLQNFYSGAKTVFEGIRKFFSGISPAFNFIGYNIGKVLGKIGDAFSSNKLKKETSRFQPIWEGIRSIFKGFGTFFEKIGPTLKTVGEGIGEFLGNLGEAIAKFTGGKSGLEVIESLTKSGFLLSLTNFIQSITGINRGNSSILKAISKDLGAVKGVLKAYQREINASTLLEVAMAIGVLSGSMWILAQIPADRLQPVGKALAQIALVIAGFSVLKSVFKLIENINAKTTGVGEQTGVFAKIKSIFTGMVSASIFANDASAKFVKFGAGILLGAFAAVKIAKAIKLIGEELSVLGKKDPEEMKQGGIVAAAILGALGAFALMSGFSIHTGNVLAAAIAALVLVKAISKAVDLIADLGADKQKMKNIHNFIDEFKDTAKKLYETIKSGVLWFVGIIAAAQVILGVASSFSKNALGVSFTLAQFGKNFLRIAASFLILDAAIYLFTKIQYTKGDIANIGILFGGFIFLVGLFQSIMAASARGEIGVNGVGLSKTISQFGKNFLRIAASFLILDAAIYLFSKIQYTRGDIVNIGILFGGFIALVGLFQSIMARAANTKAAITVGNPLNRIMKTFGTNFLKIAASLLVVAWAVDICSGININPNNVSQVKWVFLGFIALVGAFTAVSVWLSRKPLPDNKKFISTMGVLAAAMLAAAASLLIVAYAVKSITDLKLSPGQLLSIGAIFGGFLVVVGLFGVLAGALTKDWSGVAAIGAVAVSYVAAAFSLGMIASALKDLCSITSPDKLERAEKILKTFGDVLIVLALIGGVGGLLGLIPGYAGVLAVLAIAAVIASIGATALMAGIGMEKAAKGFETFALALDAIMTTVAEKGPEFSKNLKDVLDAILDAVIELAPKASVAVVELIKAISKGVDSSKGYLTGAAAASVGAFAVGFLQGLADNIELMAQGVIDVIHTLADVIRDQGPALQSALGDLFLAIFKPNKHIETSGIDLRSKTRKDNSASAEASGKDSTNKTINALTKGASNAVKDSKTTVSEQGSKDGEELFGSYADALLSKWGLLGEDGAIDYSKFSGMFDANQMFESMTNLENVDTEKYTAQFSSVLSQVFGGVDAEGDVTALLDKLGSSLSSNTTSVESGAKDVASAIEKPITSLNSNTWGSDIASGLASGMRSKKDDVSSAATELAGVIHSILGFSEPETGPLSDFHTYAPDMIKLWCAGVRDNLGLVKSSSTDMADTVYNGFSTALDYVSGLIDNGMDDTLTIRPVLDLSEIQNGMYSMERMMSSASNYMPVSTMRLASSAAYDMGQSKLRAEVNSENPTNDSNTTNNFYITNSDPNAVADKVSKILYKQTRRQKAAYAYK